MVFCIVFSPQTGWIWCQPRQSWSYNIGVKTEEAEKSERKKYKGEIRLIVGCLSNFREQPFKHPKTIWKYSATNCSQQLLRVNFCGATSGLLSFQSFCAGV